MQPVWKTTTVLAAITALGLAATGFAAAVVLMRADLVLPTLYVSYTMNCTLSITDDSGKPVNSIAPGAYQIDVETPVDFGGVDLSGIYDMTACKGSVQFQLTGPGVDLETTLDDGDSQFAQLQATFRASSSYVAQDGNQPSVARAGFTTLATGSPTTVTTTTTVASTTTSSTGGTSGGGGAGQVSRGALAGFVGVDGKLALTSKGKAVTSLASGNYKLTVTDTSTKQGFVLQQAGKRARTVTGAAFLGKETVSVNLLPGQWSFSPSAAGKKSSFVVAS